MKLRTLSLVGLVVLAAIGAVVVLAYLTVWQLAIFSVLPCLISGLGIVLLLATLVLDFINN